MQGPQIIASTMSRPSTNARWQYNSQSNNHSKVACWAILFDFLQHSITLQQHARNGTIVVDINVPLGSSTRKPKKLELVVASPGSVTDKLFDSDALSELRIRWGVRLNDEQEQMLKLLPKIAYGPVSDVRVALKAKACMTEHIKAIPRFRDELTTYHQTMHAHSDEVIAVGLAIINSSATFISSVKNGQDENLSEPAVTMHPEHAAARAVEMVREMPSRTDLIREGYDSMGVMVINLANDGSPVGVVSGRPAPAPTDDLHYDRMLGRLVKLYDERYAELP